MGLGRVAVVGAGTMGSGIAQKFATEGASVVLVDLSEEAVARGLEHMDRLLEEGIERRLFRPQQVEGIRSRIEGTTDLGKTHGCGLVVEAVFEDLDIKRQVFSQLDAITPPDTILATNTSSFPVADVQAGLARPERVIGLHFFFHPAKNRLVEVIGSEASDPDVVRRAWRWMEVLGKTPIPSSDCAGFVVNRFFVPWLNEAVRLLADRVASIPVIDAVARGQLGIGMGPFALMNATGVPITLHAATTLGSSFGSFYAPAPLLVEQVAQGLDWELDGIEDVYPEVEATIVSRLCGASWLAAGQLVDEGVSQPDDVDVGARVGLRWRHGPFEQANQSGVSLAARDVARLADTWELPVPTCFADRTTEEGRGRPFSLSTVRIQVEGGVAQLTLNRPAELNALSTRLLSDLEAAWGRVEADPDVRAVVLRGAGKAFMAGADLKFFRDALAQDDLARIRGFTERAAALYHRIDASPKRVVVLLDGLSLGGGAELVLCADHVVATDRASLGFPETGIGIYPGLGGTQRSVRRVGRPLARHLVLTGRPVDAVTAHAIGLVDVLATRQDAEDIASQLALSDDPAALATPRDGVSSPLASAAERWFGDGVTTDDVAQAARGGDEEAQRIEKWLSHKAPIALDAAARMIDLADKAGDIREGLDAELAGLESVFGSADAREGIGAILERRRPTFQGA